MEILTKVATAIGTSLLSLLQGKRRLNLVPPVQEYSEQNSPRQRLVFPSGRHRFRKRQQAFTKRLRENWRIFSANRLAVLGLVLIFCFIVMAFMQPLLMNTIWTEGIYDPLIGFDARIFPNPAPPSGEHLLGTDGMGRDVLSMLLDATSNTLVVAITSALMAAIIGTTMGAISAYYQRTPLATSLGYLNDTLLVLPTPIVMVILGARFQIRLHPCFLVCYMV